MSLVLSSGSSTPGSHIVWLSGLINGLLLQKFVVEIFVAGACQSSFEGFLARPRMELRIALLVALAELAVAAFSRSSGPRVLQ
jgi:hypothetical protein